MNKIPDLTALIGSRICHDLISPIGAIGNGVELLMLEHETSSPELAMIAESVSNATARLRFFRIAYGAAGSNHRVARNEVTGILDGMNWNGRLKIAWTTPPELARAEVKLAFLLLQCLETAMPYGGEVSVQQKADQWQITGCGKRLRLDSDLWQILGGSDAPAGLSPDKVHFLLVPDMLQQRNRQLEMNLSETRIELAF